MIDVCNGSGSEPTFGLLLLASECNFFCSAVNRGNNKSFIKALKFFTQLNVLALYTTVSDRLVKKIDFFEGWLTKNRLNFPKEITMYALTNIIVQLRK